MAGILVQHIFDMPVSIWLVLLGLFAAVTAAAFFIRRVSSVSRYVTAYLALSCFVCLGAIRLTEHGRPERNDIRRLVPDERRLATIRGRIVTEPYVSKYPDWKFARFKPTDPTTSFYLKVDEVETIAGWAKVTGTVRVQVDEPVLDLKAGDEIQAYCWLERFEPASNPGQFDMAEYLARRNVYIAASVESRSGIELLQKASATSSFVKIKRKLRQTVTQALLDSPHPQDQNQSLLQALVLGYRGDIDSKTYIAFRKTGLLHFVCLSGTNFAIVIGIIWWLCKTAGMMKPARAVVCIIAAILFLLVIPPNAPAFRAGIISFVFCASFLFRRRPSSVNSLSLAAIILLLIRPTELFEPSWQLSFAAVLGLLLFCERTRFFLHEKITGIFWVITAPVRKPFYQIAARPGPYILRVLSTCITAWLATAGISLYHFYTINWLTSLWTAVVSPLIAIVSVVAYVKVVIALFLPTAASILSIILNILSGWLIGIVKYIADLNISEILIGHTPLTMIVLYYCLVFFMAFAYFKKPLFKKVVCTITALTIITFLGAIKWQRTHHTRLTLTCLDVGHGQAILAQFPGKANVLFDTGSLHRSDIGTRIVAPFLDYAGISRIDAVIISHNDTDHINGVPEIVKHCKVGGVYADDAFFDRTDVWGTAKFLSGCLSDEGLEIRHLPKDLCMSGAATIKVLWPCEQLDDNDSLSDNDRSLVSLIEFAGARILLCSDIEEFAQAELLRLYPDLKADVVVIPHHGSAKTLGGDFLANLDPDVLICSCDQAQYERMLGDSMVLSSDRLQSFFTAADGAIRVCVKRDGTIQTCVCTKSDPLILSAQGS
jgi:competence protein ComEC